MKILLCLVPILALSSTTVSSSALASGDSNVDFMTPLVKSGGQLQFVNRMAVFPHYYAGLSEALQGSLTNWCTTKKKAVECSLDQEDNDNGYGFCVSHDADCDKVNPLNISRIEISGNYSSGAEENDISSRCEIELDLTRLRAADERWPTLQALGYDRKRKLVMLAVRTIEKNLKSSSFQDCKLTYKGLAKHPGLGRLPQVIAPLIKTCVGNKTRSRPSAAIRSRERGIKKLDAGKEKAAERLARRALASDCSDTESWLLLAETLVASDYYKSQAALLRAHALDADLAFKYYHDRPVFDAKANVSSFGPTATLFAFLYSSQARP